MATLSALNAQRANAGLDQLPLSQATSRGVTVAKTPVATVQFGGSSNGYLNPNPQTGGNYDPNSYIFSSTGGNLTAAQAAKSPAQQAVDNFNNTFIGANGRVTEGDSINTIMDNAEQKLRSQGIMDPVVIQNARQNAYREELQNEQMRQQQDDLQTQDLGGQLSGNDSTNSSSSMNQNPLVAPPGNTTANTPYGEQNGASGTPGANGAAGAIPTGMPGAPAAAGGTNGADGTQAPPGGQASTTGGQTSAPSAIDAGLSGMLAQFPAGSDLIKNALLSVSNTMTTANNSALGIYAAGVDANQGIQKESDALGTAMTSRYNATATLTGKLLDTAFDNQKVLADQVQQQQILQNSIDKQEFQFQTNKAARDMERAKAAQLSQLAGSIALSGGTYSSSAATQLSTAEYQADLGISDLKEEAAIKGQYYSAQSLQIDAQHTQSVNAAYQTHMAGTIQALTDYNNGLDKVASQAFATKKDVLSSNQSLLKDLSDTINGNHKELATAILNSSNQVRQQQQDLLHYTYERGTQMLHSLDTLRNAVGGYEGNEAAYDPMIEQAAAMGVPQDVLNSYKNTGATLHQISLNKGAYFAQMYDPSVYSADRTPDRSQVMSQAQTVANGLLGGDPSGNFRAQIKSTLDQNTPDATNQAYNLILNTAIGKASGDDKAQLQTTQADLPQIQNAINFLDEHKSELGQLGPLRTAAENAKKFVGADKDPAYRDFSAMLERLAGGQLHSYFGSRLTGAETSFSSDYIPQIDKGTVTDIRGMLSSLQNALKVDASARINGMLNPASALGLGGGPDKGYVPPGTTVDTPPTTGTDNGAYDTSSYSNAFGF